MNNKEKFRKSVDKINIDENLVKQMINRVKNEVKFDEKDVAKTELNNITKFKSVEEQNNEVRNVKGEDKNMKKGKLLKFIKTMSLSAAAMVVITTVGVCSYAAISGDTRIIKKLGIKLEGMDEEIIVAENNTEFEAGVSYTIDYMSTMVLNKQDSVDVYEFPEDEESEEKFKIYMKIYSLTDEECQNLRKDLESELDNVTKPAYEAFHGAYGGVYNRDDYIEDVNIGKGNYKATLYEILDGYAWDSRVKEVYIVEAGNKQNLIIETEYWMEATEGWGDTFKQLLSTLEIKNYKPDEIQNKNENINNNKDNTKEEKIPGTYEGMKNKFEDPGIIKIEEIRYSTEISGYASTAYDAEIDLLHKKATVTATRYANDEDPKILKKKDINLSESDAERLYRYYEERLENKSKYDYDAREDFAKKIYDEDSNLWGTIEGTYYYSFEADGVYNVYVFENTEDVQFLHSLFDNVR